MVSIVNAKIKFVKVENLIYLDEFVIRNTLTRILVLKIFFGFPISETFQGSSVTYNGSPKGTKGSLERYWFFTEHFRVL